MAQEHRDADAIMPAAAGAPPAGDSTNGGRVNLVTPQELHNMRLAIGTPERTIFEVSLGDNLTTKTRHIDIRLRQKSGLQEHDAVAPVKEEAAQGNAPPEHGPPAPSGATPGHAAAAADEENEIAPAANQEAELPRQVPQERLKITVAAEQDSDREYLNQMRGWLMAVATLFVNMAFDAMLHPPEWFKTEWYLSEDTGTSTSTPTPGEAWRAELYLVSNGFTFATALVLVLVLLRETSSAGRTLRAMRAMVSQLALFLALTFALGTSKYWVTTMMVCFSIALAYTVWKLYLVHGGIALEDYLMSYRKTKQQETRSADEPGSV